MKSGSYPTRSDSVITASASFACNAGSSRLATRCSRASSSGCPTRVDEETLNVLERIGAARGATKSTAALPRTSTPAHNPTTATTLAPGPVMPLLPGEPQQYRQDLEG